MTTASPIWLKIEQAAKLVGLDAESLCKRSHITAKQQKALQEKGASLSVAQIGRLSDQAGLPISFFLQDTTPSTADVKLRHDFNVDPADEGTPDEMAYFRNRELLRIGTLVDTMLNTEAFKPSRKLLPKITSKVTASDIAAALGIEKERAPIGPKLQAKLREHGLLYLVYPIYWEARMGGASWWHADDVPVAVIDGRHYAPRGYFTLAHETVHLIHHLPTKKHGHTCRLDQYMSPGALKAEERFTNELASELLMPKAEYATARDAVKQHGINWTVDEISKAWMVSRQALAIRLKEWELAKDRDIAKFMTRPVKDPEKKSFGPPLRPPKERFGLPSETADLVTKLYEGGASTRFIEWAAKLPYEFIFQTINNLPTEEGKDTAGA
jgi:Zn-dependent peptidase ImmA (M78 family)